MRWSSVPEVPPPPLDPPRADAAPELLVRTLYYLVRDEVPFGIVERAVQQARSFPGALPDDVIERYARRLACELVYESGTPVER